MKPQTIIGLTSENVKRIQLVQIEPSPNGSLVVIGGENEQGKSSLLDSIEMAFAGGDAIPEKPIREGASKARVVIETQDLTVTRTFTAKSTQLVVTSKDGTKINRPQELLDSLTNSVAFDPLGFLRMKDEEQAATLRKLVGIDFTALDKEAKEKYDERTLKNREVKTAAAKVEGITRHSGVPKQPVSAESIVKRIEEANEKNAENERQRKALENLNEEIDGITDEIKDLKAKLADAEQRLKTFTEQRDTVKERVLKLEDVDVTPIRAELQEIEKTNEKVADNKRWQEANDEHVKVSRESQALTERLDAIKKQKEKMLAEAKFPVAGLSFSETGIVFEGIPFDQVNTAKQLRVSVAIAFAMQPALKVAIVRQGGNDLDKKNLALLAGYVSEQGGQLWLERCSDGPECSVILEEGEVKEDRTSK